MPVRCLFIMHMITLAFELSRASVNQVDLYRLIAKCSVKFVHVPQLIICLTGRHDGRIKPPRLGLIDRFEVEIAY